MSSPAGTPTSTARAGEGLRFTAPAPRSAAAARQWRTTHAYVRAEARANPELPRQPLVVGALARLLAATALSTFPHTGRVEPDPVDRRSACPAVLRRAVAFVEEHAEQDVTTADIARAAHVSVRAVQLTFRQHLQTTPTSYLRGVRLERAREELRAADPESTTVAAVAARWGFLSASSFAAHYRGTFHELPSQTLRS